VTRFVICCGSKNSSKSLFSRFTGFFDGFHGDATTIRAGFCWLDQFDADVAANLLSFRDFLLMSFWFALLPYICWLCLFVKYLALHSGGFRFPLKRGFFLTGSRHVIFIWTSLSLISHMYLSVLINSNGVSLLAECWAKCCSPFSSAAVNSPI